MVLNIKNKLNILTAYQWDLIENLICLLQPIEELTKIASSDETDISFVIPIVNALQKYL